MKLNGRFYTMTNGAEFLLNAGDVDAVRVMIYLICSMEYDKEFLYLSEMYKNAIKKDLNLSDEQLDRILLLVLREAFVQKYKYVLIPDDRPYATPKYNIEEVRDTYILKPDYYWQGTLSGYNRAYAYRRGYMDKSPFQENERIIADLKNRREKERRAREAAERKAAREAAKENLSKDSKMV